MLKEHYTQDRVELACYKDNPLLAILSKYTQFGGKNLPISIQYGIPGGRSATYASAKANKTPSAFKEFFLTRNHDYALADIDNETIEASMGNANAMLEALTNEIDSAMLSASRSLAAAAYGDGSGAIGQVSATPSNSSGTFTVTLANVDDIANFEVGLTLNVWSALTGGTQRTSDGSDNSWPIAAVDRSAGTLTLTGTYSGSGTFAANDYLFVEGDRGGKLKGLLSWIPFTAPTSGDSFFQVDRSVDTTRLAGVRYDGSAVPIEEALIEGASRIGREGYSPDYCFMNFSKWSTLEKSLSSKIRYEMVQVPLTGAHGATIGFKAIAIEGPRSTIKVIPDHNCPSNYTWMLSMDYWKLYSLGSAPKMLMSDGNKFLRVTDADSVEARIGYYAQLGCRAPGANAIIKLS